MPRLHVDDISENSEAMFFLTCLDNMISGQQCIDNFRSPALC